jgi:hypothetical protein
MGYLPLIGCAIAGLYLHGIDYRIPEHGRSVALVLRFQEHRFTVLFVVTFYF